MNLTSGIIIYETPYFCISWLTIVNLYAQGSNIFHYLMFIHIISVCIFWPPHMSSTTLLVHIITSLAIHADLKFLGGQLNFWVTLKGGIKCITVSNAYTHFHTDYYFIQKGLRRTQIISVNKLKSLIFGLCFSPKASKQPRYKWQ